MIIPSQLRHRIGVQYLREPPITLFFKFICTRLKQQALPYTAGGEKTWYEFVSQFFTMVIRIESPTSLSIAFEWMNGVRLDFPDDYLEDNYTPEKIFSVLQLLYDTFDMRCSESFTNRLIHQYSTQYRRSRMERLWDQSRVLRRSIRNDPIYLAVKALDPIVSRGLRGFW